MPPERPAPQPPPAPLPALEWLAPLLLAVLVLGGWLLWQRYGLSISLLLNEAWLLICG